MFVWILLTGQTVAAVCVRACALSVSVVSVCLCKRRTGARQRGRGVWSVVFSSARCPRLVLYALQLSQQANYVEKLQRRAERDAFPSTGEEYTLEKKINKSHEMLPVKTFS